MNAIAYADLPSEAPAAAPEMRSPPLAVLAALRRFAYAVRQAHNKPDADELRRARRASVMALIARTQSRDDVDTISSFEDLLNGCLDLAYRAQPLAAFVFDVLHKRLAGRVRRRLLQAGQDPDSPEVADLVSATAIAIHRLIQDSRREKYTLRYALLVSIADHRTIDHLRRRRPEYRETMDDRASDVERPGVFGRAIGADPEQRMCQQERLDLAHRMQRAVLGAVNELPRLERAALVLVEVEACGYPEVSARLGIKATDVGNVVRRARLKRDRALVGRLRAVEGLGDCVGFGALQADRDLRLNMLGWAADIGAGVCECCRRKGTLHLSHEPCEAVEPGEAFEPCEVEAAGL